MKIALECPTSLLGDIQPLADFDWILAHLVLQDEEYADFYRKSKRLKVLDNSVNELLEPCNFADLERAADVVRPDLVVSPDYLGEEELTIEALDASLDIFGKNSILPVVQGSSLPSVERCFKEILSRGLPRVAVPYDICCSREESPEAMAASRLRVVNRLWELAPSSFQVHLLGFNTVEELRKQSIGKFVNSIDTGVPIMMGHSGHLLDRDKLPDKKTPTYEKMANLDYGSVELACSYYNIAYLRKIVNGG